MIYYTIKVEYNRQLIPKDETYTFSAFLITDTASATSHIVSLPSCINASQSGAGISWATCQKDRTKLDLVTWNFSCSGSVLCHRIGKGSG